MHEGPVAALPVQQQSNRHICPQAVGVSLGDLQGQVPLLTHSSNSKLRTMSEPVPLLHCAVDPVVSHADRWKELNSELKQNGHCEGSQSSDMAPEKGQDEEGSDPECPGAEYLKRCETISPQRQEGSPAETPSSNELLSTFSPALDRSGCNHLPASTNATEDSSLDLLRVVKHKPSAIVFCDYDHGSDNQVICANESSDGRESSSSASGKGVGADDDDEEDEFPEMLRYKEFLVSRQRRSLNRNRKGLRKRQDAKPVSTASGSQKSISEVKPELTGSQEEQGTQQSNEKQVRIMKEERSNNKYESYSLCRIGKTV